MRRLLEILRGVATEAQGAEMGEELVLLRGRDGLLRDAEEAEGTKDADAEEGQ